MNNSHFEQLTQLINERAKLLSGDYAHGFYESFIRGLVMDNPKVAKAVEEQARISVAYLNSVIERKLAAAEQN